MNLGLSGPMSERRADMENARDENEGAEHRDIEPKGFLGIWGGIVGYECRCSVDSTSSCEVRKVWPEAWICVSANQPHRPATALLSTPEFFSDVLLPAPSPPSPVLPHSTTFQDGNRKEGSPAEIRQGKVGDGMANVKVKGENFYR